MKRYVAIIGPGSTATEQNCRDARRAASLLAADGIVIVTGGLDGVMAAATEGAASAGGVTLGLLPGRDRRDGHPDLTVSVPTGLGELRNGLVVRSADCVLAVGGSWGTLSEVALAVRIGVPVVALDGWPLPEDHAVQITDDVEEAVAAVQDVIRSAASGEQNV